MFSVLGNVTTVFLLVGVSDLVDLLLWLDYEF